MGENELEEVWAGRKSKILNFWNVVTGAQVNASELSDLPQTPSLEHERHKSEMAPNHQHGFVNAMALAARSGTLHR